MPARNLTILILATIISMLCYRTASRNHFGGLLAGAIGEISSAFVRPVDERQLFEGAMEGMVERLDPYSDYISPEELQEFQEDLDQNFGGIGIVVEVNQETNRLTVLSPLPDTPAYGAGMRAGDQILAIDGQSTKGFQIRDAVDLMRGEPGTSLTITVLHLGETDPVEMTMRRAIIPVASVLGDVRNPDGTWQYTLESEPRIGFIRLATFGEKTAEELRETLRAIQPNIDGLILDVRGNGGGLLASAVEVCDLFVDSGKIVSIRGRRERDWRDYVATESGTVVRELPIVVLVDGFSASASEITAACLQDHGRAMVVGTRTWGKGTVQNVVPFEAGRSALKLTVATYWRPNGHNIHRHVDVTEEAPWGVTPDAGYAVETDEETLRKIVYLRRERDRVRIDETKMQGRDEVANGDPTEDGEQATPNGLQIPDLTGFEDPQVKRAIEAVKELIAQPAPSQPERQEAG